MMRRHLRTTLLVCSLGLIVPSLSGTAKVDAEPADQLSYMTFNQPVMLPGVTLPAGEYIFRLPDRHSSRMFLQVLSGDRAHVVGMFLMRPTSRMEPTTDPTVTFHESPAGTAPPVQAWYYAGETFGLEFAYPKQQAERIARDSNGHVLTTDLTFVE
jgi:hypothetical protein